MNFETKQVPINYDELAPDGSEIRLLPNLKGGGMCHCTLPVGKTSRAVKHKTVEEIWYFLEGQDVIWRKKEAYEDVVKLGPDISLTIPLGTNFQFRNTGKEPLRFIIVTMPPWPGPEGAEKVEDYW